MPHGIKISTFPDDGEVEEVFASTNVRTRDTVFLLFVDAGTNSATEAELQEFGESVRVKPDEAEGLSLALRRPEVEPEEAEGTSRLTRKCKTKEVENNPILSSCEDEPWRPAPTQPEHVPR